MRTATPHHGVVEDALGLVCAVTLLSFGLFVLHGASLVTGGTAGLALLVGYLTGIPYGLVFAVVNVPFLVLAVAGKGWRFALRSALTVLAAAVVALLLPLVVGPVSMPTVVAAFLGNVLAGVGLVVLFRHHSSLGGFGILALVLQERRGWRAGYVLMVLDSAVVLASLTVAPPLLVLTSAGGAILMNLIVGLNHRPGRYALG